MLDDLKYVHRKDSLDLLGQAARQIDQLQPSHELSPASHTCSHVVWCAGSDGRVASELLRQWPGLTVPFEVSDYESLPVYVGKQTLVLLLMDGTAAAAAALQRARTTGAVVVLFGTAENVQQHTESSVAAITLLGGEQWFTTLQLWAELTGVTQAFGLTANSLTPAKLTQLQSFLKQQVSQWLPTVPTKNNTAKQLALELIGRSIILQAGPLLYPAIQSWKSTLNRTAQTVAWTSRFPDFIPSEFLGWTSHPVEKPYASACLRSSYDSATVQQSFAMSERLLSGRWPAPEQIIATGESRAEQLASSVILGDFVSIYIALLNGKNPGKDSQTIMQRATFK